MGRVMAGGGGDEWMCGARVRLCFGWPETESASLTESTNHASSTELADLLITLSDVPSLTDRAAFQYLFPLLLSLPLSFHFCM